MTRVGRHHSVSVPKHVDQTKPHQKAEGTRAPTDTQEIAATKPSTAVTNAQANVGDTLRFVKQSFDQLDQQLLLVPQPLKMQLADSLRGYGDPPAGAENQASQANQIFAAVDQQIKQLSVDDRAQLFELLTIPYDKSNADGESASSQTPGAPTALNPLMNPLMNGAMTNPIGANGQPMNPGMNPMMMQPVAAESGPSNPMEMLKEIVVRRVALTAHGSDPIYAIDWQNPLGTLFNARPNGAPLATSSSSNVWGAVTPMANPPPETAVGNQSGPLATALAAQGVTKEGLSQLASALAADMTSALQYGLTPQQFQGDIAPLLNWLKLEGRAVPGAGAAVLIFNAQTSRGLDPQRLEALSAQLAAM